MRMSTYVLFCMLISCQSNVYEKNTIKGEPTQKNVPSLNDSLLSRKLAWEIKADSVKKKLYAEGIKYVEFQGTLNSALKNGDIAPSFELKNAEGKLVKLSDYLEKGPVVLTWYRGGWCPYCNITLHYLQSYLPRIKNENANLIALTPELPDSSLSTKEKQALEFEVLSDLHNDVARKYGIVYKLLPGVAKSYQDAFKLHLYNGDSSDELPLSATYIISKNGTIEFAFLAADYRERADPEEIINSLKRLNH